jgi:CheY-like chemotaxis protein
MTASALVEDRRACVDAGMDDFRSKPVRLQDLELALGVAATRIRGRISLS